MELLAALGLLWAPFAALISALTAKSRGLSPRRSAITGAIFSMLFLLPWIYLWAWQRNRPLSSSAIASGYVLLYGLWTLGLIGQVGVVLLVHSGDNLSESSTSGGMTVLFVALIAMLILSVCQLGIAGMKSYNPFSNGERILPLHPPSHLLYLSPFIYAYISMILLFLFIFGFSPFEGLVYN